MRSDKKVAIRFLPALLALVAMLVAACGGSATPGNTGSSSVAPAAQQILRWGLPVADIKTLDPAQNTDLYSSQSDGMLFTGLVQGNDQLQVSPQLAKSWDISSDGLTYTFYLKSGITFSDGTPITPDDVAFSIDRALSPAISSLTYAPGAYLALIKDSDKRMKGKISTLIGDSLIPDDASNTIKIIISQKAAYFLQSLTYPTAWVLEKSFVEKYGTTKWMNHLTDNGGSGSSGPFILQKYDHSIGLTFVPNPHWYGQPTKLKQVQFNFYQKGDAMYKAYQTNQIDSSRVPAANLSQAEKLTGQYIKAPSLAISYLGLNYLVKPFDNIDIRQAFSLAINRDIIATNINKGAVTASCHIVPEGMPGYDPNLQCPGGGPLKGDPAKAKQLFQQGLQAEGLTTATFPSITLTYETGSQAVADMITTMVQEWQTALGVTIKTQPVDFETLVTETNNTTCTTPSTPQKCAGKGLQMWALAWIADYPDPQDWTTLQFGANQPANNTNYGQNLSPDVASQQQVQALMAKADADTGPDRMSLYNQAEEKLVNDVAWMSLYQQNRIRVIKPYVKGIVLNAWGMFPPNDWANTYITTH